MDIVNEIQDILRERRAGLTAKEISDLFINKDKNITPAYILSLVEKHPDKIVFKDNYIFDINTLINSDFAENQEFKSVSYFDDKFLFRALDILRGIIPIHSHIHHILGIVFYLKSPEILEEDEYEYVKEHFANKNKSFHYLTEHLLNALKKLNSLERFKGIFEKLLNDEKFIINYKEQYNSLINLFIKYQNVNKNSDLVTAINNFIYKHHYSEKAIENFQTPHSLRNLISEITELKENSTVYDPACGIGGFLMDVAINNPKIRIIGEEINEDIYSLTKQIIFLNQKPNILLHNVNSLFNSYVSDNSVDYILADIPMGGKWNINNVDHNYFIPSSNSTVLFIQLILSKLNQEGKAYIIVNPSFLYGEGTEKKLRKYLVENDFIETIIDLPKGLYKPYTQIKQSLLVLNKNKPFINEIHVINAESFAEQKSAKEPNQLKFGELAELIKERKERKQVCKTINYDEIIEKNYSLSVIKYFSISEIDFPELKFYKKELKPLNSVLSRRVSHPFSKDAAYENEFPVVKIRDLKSNVENFELSVNDDLDKYSFEEKDVKLIAKPSLLVAKIGDKLKPTYFNYEDDPILITSNIFAYEVDFDQIDLEYLIHELNSEYFQFQLKNIKKGIAQPYFTKKEFEQLLIRVPDLPQQRARVEENKKVWAKSINAQEAIQKERQLSKEKEFNIISTLKHNLSQNLGTLENDLDFLKKYLVSLDGKRLAVHEKINDTVNESILDIIKRIDLKVKNANQSLNRTEDLIKKPDLIKERIDYISFIENNIIPQFKGNSKYELIKKLPKGKNQHLEVEIDRTSIQEVFKNIIQNAIDHGFVDPEKKYNIEIKIELTEDKEYVSTKVSNDGLPFPGNFTEDRFREFGQTFGPTGKTGVGGQVIYDYVNKNGGTLHIYNKNELMYSEYNVQFEFLLPVITNL